MARNEKQFILMDECNGELVGDVCATMSEIEDIVQRELDDHGDDGDYTVYELIKANRQPVKGGWKLE